MKAQHILASASGLLSAANGASPDPKRQPLPPMGFNNWARYMCDINEKIFVDAADTMSKNGLLAAGYNRLNLDDCWSTKKRDATNNKMVWDTTKFPQGLPWLTKYVKSKGFIPGIYSDSGTLSCGGYPGTLGYEELDLQTFSDWGFEYLKLDGCYVPTDKEAAYHEIYTKWFKLLANFPKPVVFSDSAPAYFSGAANLTDWYTVMNWAADYGQLARHSDDILVYRDGNGTDAWKSMMVNYGQHVRLARYQQPGYFNDPDFLNTDHRGYTMDEKKTHFALWASFSAPLIISADIPNLSAEEIAFLSNKDLIAVDQDPLVQQATLVSQDATWDVLSKSLANGDRLLTVLNKGETPADITVSWARLGIRTARIDPNTELNVKDLWTGASSKVKISAAGVSAKAVPRHGTAVFRISGRMGGSDHPIVTPTGQIFNTFSLKCLTDDKSGTVSWKACDASDAQVWVHRDDGHINSLLRPDECIVDANGHILSRHSGCHTDAWTYYKGGNLVNNNNGHCLTENADGSASSNFCEYETNDQVVGLPIGVPVVDVTNFKKTQQ
ncbi:hypothetical protein VHEMI04639 [[Torrubiella] hemipterigena]|uniref:Alpha-galactosidase n=1 Tax=[Torrubiella] hemipterigena TaxID=1531966 RepID=A0A0A1TGT8_9HYPO|nr:hypothetical protein VHEMI04639 [[Torrubiella] hemipterigena]